MDWSKLWQRSSAQSQDTANLTRSVLCPTLPSPKHRVWLDFYISPPCVTLHENIPSPPHDQEWHLTSMHCQVSEMLIHLGSPVKSEKHTVLISVDTLKSVSGWLLLFLRFTCYYEEYMAHSDSWQRQACLRRVKRCEQVLLRCWHWLGSEYIWGKMFFFFFFLTMLTMLSCSVFTQYLIPVDTVSGNDR